jgi:hypothetical protein
MPLSHSPSQPPRTSSTLRQSPDRDAVVRGLAAAVLLASVTTAVAQVGNPQIVMGVVGGTTVFPAGEAGYPEDLTGRMFDGLESGDWQRRWTLASDQMQMPISWFSPDGGAGAPSSWLYGWGAINRLQHPIATGTYFPRGGGQIIAPVCVAGASAHATGLSSETAYHIAQGVASTRTVYTIISTDLKTPPPAPIPVSVTITQTMGIGSRWISADTGFVDAAGGGWFRITGAGIATPFNYEWGQLASLDDSAIPSYEQPEVVWGTNEGFEGGEQTQGFGCMTALETGVGSCAFRQATRETAFVIQPIVNSKNKVKPSSVTFIAEIHTAAEASVIAQLPGHPDFEHDFARFGGIEVGASGAFTNWQLPPGYMLAIVDDPTPVTKVVVQVLNGGKIKVGSKLKLSAHDGWGPASWTDMRATRLARDLFLSTTYGYRLVGNSRTLFYRDVNGNNAIDSSDSLLGESNDILTPSITVKVKKSWGKKFKVLAVSENALGQRGTIAIKTVKVAG